MTQVLNYLKDDTTYINADGREVCKFTLCSDVNRLSLLEAYTKAVGGSLLENDSSLTQSGYKKFKKEDDLDKEPSSSLSFESSSGTLLMVSTKILEDLEDKKLLTDSID